MIGRLSTISSVVGVRATSFGVNKMAGKQLPMRATPVLHLSMSRPLMPTLTLASPIPMDPADKVMPTPLLDPKPQEEKSMGTGHPQQRGKRKVIQWLRRKPWFHRQWSLDLARVSKGPSTPTFPNGVPFTKIRKFVAFSGPGFGINVGHRRKHRLSLKRGRRRLKN